MTTSETPALHVTLCLPDETATRALAERLGALARPGDVIALSGDLGAGKTAFARAFIRSLPAPAPAPAGNQGEEEVPSPTFTLVQTYDRAPASVWHFDLYRLEQPEEAYELGIEEAFAEGITLIEWPERLGSLLPGERLELTLGFAADPNARRAELTATGTWRGRLGDLKADA